MEYSKFKTACQFQEILPTRYKVNQSTLFLIQRMFDKSRTLFFLSDTYNLAIWYESLFQEFKNLIENESLKPSERLVLSLSIYKSLFIKYNLLSIKSKNKIRDINKGNNLLSHTA